MTPKPPSARALADTLVWVGAGLLSFAAGLLHYAAGFAVAGVSLVLIGLFLVNVDGNGEGGR